MERELRFYFGDQAHRAFLGHGFFDFSATPSPLHYHHYTEIQMLLSGSGHYAMNGVSYTLQAGQALLIPAHLYHQTHGFTPDSRHIAFQITLPLPDLCVKTLPAGMTAHFFQAIERYLHSRKSEELSAFLSMLCIHLAEPARDWSLPTQDRTHLIHEFFANHYHQPITLSDLAQVLGLSTKQAGRLLLHYTGRTFREELTRCRMEAARRMMAETNAPPLTVIAERVGYQSYSGFWKAFRNEK